MRDEVWRVEDFLAKWEETGKTAGKIASSDPVAMILMKEIDAYRRAIPNLKYVRGNGWEKKHWNKLFDMIHLPTKGPNAVTPENLTLAHFLDKADNLAKACTQPLLPSLLRSCPSQPFLVSHQCNSTCAAISIRSSIFAVLDRTSYFGIGLLCLQHSLLSPCHAAQSGKSEKKKALLRSRGCYVGKSAQLAAVGGCVGRRGHKGAGQPGPRRVCAPQGTG